jgi:hypothetical protein
MSTPHVPLLLENGWLSGTVVPSRCDCGISPPFYNIANGVLYACMNEIYVPLIGGTGGPVTNLGPLTNNVVVLGAGGNVVQSGSPSQLVPTLPGNVNLFLDGTGAFSTPAGSGGTVTHTAGALTLNAPVLGNSGGDVKIGTSSQLVPTLPGDSTKFLDGTGNFSTPILTQGPLVIAGGAFSGGSSALVAGSTPGVSLVYCVPVIRGCFATSWTITVDTGTVGIRVWRIAAGTAVPTAANTITTSDLAIGSGTNLKSVDFTNFLGGAAPIFNLGDIIAIQLNAASGATYAAFSLVGL